MPKSKILLVDDDPDILETVDFFLTSCDYQVYKAHNGREALKQVKLVRPDLLLLDVMMPELSGLEVCNRLKKDPETRHIPVIMLTALGTAEDVTNALKEGAVNYILKPFNFSDMLARIEKLLSLSGKKET